MAKVEVKMPQMGESITEGTVIAWHKKPGDAIEQDETLLEIGTDKVDTDVPAPESGTVVEILVEEGATVDVGTPIAIIDTEAEAGSAGYGEGTAAAAAGGDGAQAEDAAADVAVATDSGGDGLAAEAPATEESSATQSGTGPSGSNDDAVDVVMPKMGESIIEGTIIAWHKKPGDTVALDETLLEIATDKVDTEVPSPAAGTLHEILVEEGETVEVGTVLARIGGAAPAPGKRSEKRVSEKAAAASPAEVGVRDHGPAVDEKVGVADTDGGARVILRTASDGRFFSPLVRSIAEKEGLSMQELESIEGSGHGGRLTKKDLVGYLETGRPSKRAASGRAQVVSAAGTAASQPIASASGRTEIIEMDRMRQIIANHMIESKRTSAHVTSFAEVDVTGLVELRNARKHEFLNREGVKLTVTPFFVKAAVEALREHPILNSSVEEKRIIIKRDIHVGIAVAIGKTGLVVPVIKNAGDKSITGLARAAADLAERARSKQLQPDDLQGGTFTVTNIGSLGSVMGTPIIPQPQVAILATGAIKKRPVVIEDDRLGDVIAIRQMAYLSLSYDHRIIDGAMASSFLHRMIEELESYTAESEL